MRYTLVQGAVQGACHCESLEGLKICWDEETKQQHPEGIFLDYVPSQGFRLYTNSQYLATHLRLCKHIAEI